MTGTPSENEKGDSASAPDSAFRALAGAWMQDQVGILLSFVWQAYASMRHDAPFVDGRDLERSITQLLEPRIRAAMSGDEPFYIQHGPFERETMAPQPAQPPQYDLAFVLISNERLMWPLEAKVMETPSSVAAYERDVRDQYLQCRYAPFSDSGAMLGYLLSGSATDALTSIEEKLGCKLSAFPLLASKPHRISDHSRTVPKGKPYPLKFRCHHLIFDFSGLQRVRGSAENTA